MQKIALGVCLALAILAITDIALLKPTEQSITLPDTRTVLIQVSEFSAGAEHMGEKKLM